MQIRDILLLLSFGFSLTAWSAHARSLEAEPTLRQLADAKGITFGTAAGDSFWGADKRYQATMAREFNTVVAEYHMKFGKLHPRPIEFEWRFADSLMRFAGANGMKVRGHCLLWHKEAGWLDKVDFPRDSMMFLIHRAIDSIVGRYRGKIPQWDVVNEAISNNADSLYRDTFLFRRLGIDFIDSAFFWARAADSGAKLYYNEYGNEALGLKSQKTYDFVKGLKERGVPVDGIGLQCHFDNDSVPSLDSIAANLKRLSDLDLDIALTEVDIRITLPVDSAKLAKQKANYLALMKTCLENPRCKTFLVWGVQDTSSWVLPYHKGRGSPLLFNNDFSPKPAYFGVWEALAGRPNAIRQAPRKRHRLPIIPESEPGLRKVNGALDLAPSSRMIHVPVR
jgi:endo-1,4-beta-xylanase